MTCLFEDEVFPGNERWIVRFAERCEAERAIVICASGKADCEFGRGYSRHSALAQGGDAYGMKRKSLVEIMLLREVQNA